MMNTKTEVRIDKNGVIVEKLHEKEYIYVLLGDNETAMLQEYETASKAELAAALKESDDNELAELLVSLAKK